MSGDPTLLYMLASITLLDGWLIPFKCMGSIMIASPCMYSSEEGGMSSTILPRAHSAL